MKSKYIFAIMLGVILTVASATLAIAQSSPPAPYVGMKNPFDWNDPQAQAAGKNTYQQNCSGCHGVAGNGLPGFDFSSPAYSQKMETQPDFYFWILSEGRLDKGMPPYKSSLSEEQRWQTLTYMHSLSSASTPGPAGPGAPSVEGLTLNLLASPEAQTGENLTFTAILKDSQNQPVSGAFIQFYLTEDFFTQGQMEIGQAATNAQGEANFNYVPKIAGEQTLIAKYQTLQTESKLNILDSGQFFYESETGIRFQAGPEVFIGPPSSHELGDKGEAPNPALRLPGGLFSWLWLYIGVTVLVWGVYAIVMLQTLRISEAHHHPANINAKLLSLTPRINTRLVPLIGLVVVFGLGVLIVFMIITGPYSHFHLAP